jgi:hypothetical protein
MMLKYRGKLVHDLTVGGETRVDGFYPRHVNALQLRHDRFLLLITSGGWRVVDDNRSLIYQIRADTYDGPIIQEGFITQGADDWEILGDGRQFRRETISPNGFGVPSGAVIDGNVPVHAGLFVIMWRRRARATKSDAGWQELDDKTAIVEWTQVRLNTAGNELEVIQPAQPLRQCGYDNGYVINERIDMRRVECGMAQPVPMDNSGMRWISSAYVVVHDTEHSVISLSTEPPLAVAHLEFTFDANRGLYQWTRTGPASVRGLWEPSPIRWRNEWLMSARRERNAPGKGIAWLRTSDPFNEICEPTYVTVPSRGLQTSFLCADGRVRIFANDSRIRPGWPGVRNPLYMWEVDPDNGFSCGDPEVLFDAVDWKMSIRNEAGAVVDQAKVFPHAGGSRQMVVHRVRTFAIDQVEHAGITPNDAERDAHGLYYSELIYDQDYPGLWQFK